MKDSRLPPFLTGRHTSEPERSQPIPVQARLSIGSTYDEFEKEAEQVADTVMRMPDSSVSINGENTGVVFDQDDGSGFTGYQCTLCECLCQRRQPYTA